MKKIDLFPQVTRSLGIFGFLLLYSCGSTTTDVRSGAPPPRSDDPADPGTGAGVQERLESTPISGDAPSSDSRRPELATFPTSDRGGPGRPGAIAPGGPAQGIERFRIVLGGEARSAPAAVEGTLVIATRNGRVTAVDPENGEQRWTAGTLAIRGSGPAISGDFVFVAEVARSGSLKAFDLATGERRWSQRIGASTSSPIAMDETVYVLSERHRGIVAYEGASGRQVWASEIEGWRGSPAGLGDRIFVGTERGVVALGAHDGGILWRAELAAPTSSPAVLIGLGVVVTLETGGAAALGIDNGEIRWRNDDLEDPLGLPALDGRRVYLVAGEQLVALDPATGAPIWRAPAASGTSPTIAGDRVYVLVAPDRLAAYDAASGASLFEVEFERPVGALPVVAHGAVYIALRVDMNGEAALVALGDGSE